MPLIFFIAILALFAGCTSEESLPVREEKLIEVLRDVHIAESALQSYGDPEKDSLAVVYYRQIMTIHDMDREVFDTCIAILRRNPKLMQEIYGKAFEHIEKEKLEME